MNFVIKQTDGGMGGRTDGCIINGWRDEQTYRVLYFYYFLLFYNMDGK